jgi:vacuolar-type H+-ATPase subunit E/Vma4
MALDDLIHRLEQEAQSRAEAARRDADAEVRAIEAATERSVGELMARQLEHGRAARRAAAQTAVARARQQARSRELDARREQIARVLARARALIAEVARSDSYARAMTAHAREALSFVEGLQPRVRCHSAFVPYLEAAISAYPAATLAIDDTLSPGVVAEARDGSVIVDNTLAARLSRAEIRLTIELARRLSDAE